jgi:branched-chain amino acid transport system ATP-binding protein
MGFRKPVSGSIGFKDRTLLGLRPFEIARLGVGFAPEESEVFGELTVAENVALPTWTCPNERTATERINEAYNVFPNLRRYMQRDGQALSGGERKMLSIARALALGPKLLLLDEPTEGLSPAIVPSIVQGLSNIRAFGHAVFIAESISITCRTLPTGSMSLNGEKLFSPGGRVRHAGTRRLCALSRA